jgi:hypothetical protein
MQPFGEIVKNHYDAKQVPSFRELFNGIRNIFLNTQPFLNFPMPPGYPSKVVHIGGIQMSNSEYETKSLDEMVRIGLILGLITRDRREKNRVMRVIGVRVSGRVDYQNYPRVVPDLISFGVL